MNADWVIVRVKFIILWGLAVSLAACGKDRPAATFILTHTPAAVTPAATLNPTLLAPITLPPTWTPLPTRTPIPTRPPATPTLSPTPLPTLSAAQLCDHFQVITSPAENAQLEYDATVTFSWRGVPNDSPVILAITKHGEKAGIRAEIPVPGDSLLPLPLTRLPSEGQYDWKIWLRHPQYGEICERSGTFIRKPAVLV